MLKTFMIGNLGGDPESRMVQSGEVSVSFQIAVNNGRGRAPTWVKVTAWDQLGSICAQYLRKGSKVAVVGRPSARAWMGANGVLHATLEVTAAEVEFLSGKNDEQNPDEGADAESGYAPADPEDRPY